MGDTVWSTNLLPCCPALRVQSGEPAAAVEAKKRELEAKRAAQASKAEKQFFKITVTVLLDCLAFQLENGM